MIVTKPELLDFLAVSCESTFISHMLLFAKLVDILDWHDDEPRDIKIFDIEALETILAQDVDVVLSNLEKTYHS